MACVWIVRGCAVFAAAAGGCNTFGPPAPMGTPPPPQCQQIIDQCRGPAGAATVSAADDCVRIATDMTTTAARCVELQDACAAACTGAAMDAGAAESGE
jgi:hypothetical protein